MSNKENINSPEGKCNSLYGVIGKPFIGGAYIFNPMERLKFNGYRYYVYLTTNNVNGMQYVGSRKTNKNLIPNDRYVGSGLWLLNAVKIYGKKNFSKEILAVYLNQKDAFIAEEYFIKLHNTLKPNGYNLSPTGGLGVVNCHTPETQKQINEKLKIIRNTPEYKKHRSEISKQACSDPDYRLKIKEGVLRYAQENPEKIAEFKRKQREEAGTPEASKRMSECKKKYYKENPDAYEKASNAMKKYYKETPGAHEKCSKVAKEAMNRPEVKEKLSKIVHERFQNMLPGEWSESQKIWLSNPSTRQKMSESGKNKKPLERICVNCGEVYIKKCVNQFNKELCDDCRKIKKVYK